MLHCKAHLWLLLGGTKFAPRDEEKELFDVAVDGPLDSATDSTSVDTPQY